MKNFQSKKEKQRNIGQIILFFVDFLFKVDVICFKERLTLILMSAVLDKLMVFFLQVAIVMYFIVVLVVIEEIFVVLPQPIHHMIFGGINKLNNVIGLVSYIILNVHLQSDDDLSNFRSNSMH